MNAKTASVWLVVLLTGLSPLFTTSAWASLDPFNNRPPTCADSVRRLRESNRNLAALLLAKRCLPTIIQTEAGQEASQLYFEIALCERKEGRFVAGISAIKQAIHWADRGTDTLTAVQSRYVLAMLYADQGDYAQAVAQSYANLRWHQRVPNSDYEASTHQLLAEIYERLRNPSAAAHHVAEHRRLSLQSRLPEQQMLAYNNEAKRLTKLRKYGWALRYQRKAVAAVRRLPKNLLPELTDQLVQQAELQRQLRQYASASASLQEATGWLKRNWSPAAQALIYSERASIYLATNDTAGAYAVGKKAVQYARLSKRPDVVLSTLHTLQRVQQRSGAYQAALETVQATFYLFDSLATVTKTQAIAEVETRYGVAQKEARIQALRKEATIQRLRDEVRQRALQTAERQRMWLMIGLVTLTIGLVIIGYLFRRARRLQAKTEQQRQILEEQATQLFVANTTKDRLFSIIGHDLRSSAIQLHQSLAQMTSSERGPADGVVSLHEAERSAHRLGQQINNLLYWALTQQDGLQIHLRREPLAALVTDALNSFGAAFRRKYLDIRNETGDEWVETDERLTLLVLRNLLDNALKFTPAGGRIRLSSNRINDAVFLVIQDNGPGLVATQKQNEPSQAGTGLGLLVANELMEHCGGILDMDSTQLSGTTATLKFKGA